MTLTREDWKEVEERVDRLLGSADLDCDGYLVTLRLVRVKKMQLGIMVYVDGKVRTDWMYRVAEDCPGRKFYRRKELPVYTPKQKEQFAKVFGKKAAQKDRGLHETIEAFDFYWTDFQELRRHLQKNNNSIRLLSSVEAEQRHKALKEKSA